jgi:hypothetical protein
VNQLLYDFAVWLDSQTLSTSIHESYYMYNWIESTHVLTLMLCLGMLFVIDLRMVGLAFTNVPATKIAHKLDLPMLIGFGIMFITGILLFYAVPVRSTQSIWFRFKVILLIAAAVNAYLFQRNMAKSGDSWDMDIKAPKSLRVGATLSLLFWITIVAFGRFIAYDWFDCQYTDPGLSQFLSGCIPGQTQF